MKYSTKSIHYILISTLMIILFGCMQYISIHNYLIPHTFFELVGAAVAMTIFCIGWNTREYSKNNFMLVLATGYVFVGFLTVFHTISYKGMGVFPGNDTNMPTQFWIAARYFESFTILLATFYLNKKKKVSYKLLLGFFTLAGTGIIISIFTDIFPNCLHEDTGLTMFKIISEYIISGIFIIAGYALWRQKQHLQRDVFHLMLVSILLKVLSELSFTLYSDPFGLFNLIGHFFMAISVFFIYQALVLETLKRPYRTLFHDVVSYAEEITNKNNELIVKDQAMSTSLNAIVLVDIDYIITYVNQSFLNLLGYEEQEVLNKNAFDFLENINEIKLTEGSWYGEIFLKKKDESLLCGLLTINLIHSEQETPICFMASFLDITNRKEMEQELKRAKQEADAANQAKSIFLANMSHEIRTPMNGIVGFLQLLENTPTTQEQTEYIHNMKISTDALLRVINDILDVSKIEAGKMVLDKVPFDLHQVIKNAVIPFTAKAAQKELDLNMHIRSDVPQYVIGDPDRLRQVISNLINNGIKFTQTGYVVLKVANKGMKGDHLDLQFTIEDSGIGMSQSVIEKIFHPFIQADDSTHRTFGGSGLGLTICESIIRLMNGSITVESTEGKGTKFTFNISLQEDQMKLSAAPTNASPPTKYLHNPSPLQDLDRKDIDSLTKTPEYNTIKESTSYKLKVLIVEDNEINRSFFSKVLNHKGIDYDIAVDGQEAIEACLSQHYDLVFMDCQMPVMDGYEATRRIRQGEGNNKHTTIIAMTAYALSGDAEKCMKAGMDDYLTKPIDHHKLTEVIHKYAPKSISAKKQQKQEYMVRLMNETGFDLQTAEELIELGLNHIKHLIEEALQHLQKARYDEVSSLLHQLKGAGGNLRLKEIVDLVIQANNELSSGSHEASYRTLSSIKDILDTDL